MSNLRPNIWQLQAQRDSKGLINALQNEAPEVRRQAAAALRVIGAVEAIPALRRALAAEQDALTHTHLDMVLETLLAERQETEAARSTQTFQLIAQLKSSDPDIIIRAAQALGRLKDKTAVEALVLVFHNALLPANVRLAAAEALIEMESAPAVVTLVAALKSPSWQARRNAAAMLGLMNADWAVERLVDRLRDDHALVQRTAYAALQRIGTPRALEAARTFASQQARQQTPTAAPPQQKPAPAAPPPEVTPDKAKTQESPVVRSEPQSDPPVTS